MCYYFYDLFYILSMGRRDCVVCQQKQADIFMQRGVVRGYEEGEYCPPPLPGVQLVGQGAKYRPPLPRGVVRGVGEGGNIAPPPPGVQLVGQGAKYCPPSPGVQLGAQGKGGILPPPQSYNVYSKTRVIAIINQHLALIIIIFFRIFSVLFLKPTLVCSVEFTLQFYSPIEGLRYLNHDHTFLFLFFKNKDKLCPQERNAFFFALHVFNKMYVLTV